MGLMYAFFKSKNTKVLIIILIVIMIIIGIFKGIMSALFYSLMIISLFIPLILFLFTSEIVLKKEWLTPTIIGVICGFYLFLLDFVQSIFWYIFKNSGSPFRNSIYFIGYLLEIKIPEIGALTVIFLSLLYWTILGALIGFLYGKMKNKNRR